jgi:predicted nucleotidyltransferase
VSPIDTLPAIKIVATALGDLRAKVMFVGGAITGLLVTDLAAPASRPTDDVDVVVDIATGADYIRLVERLRDLGFVEDSREGAPTCRWVIQAVTVDVLPTGSQHGAQNRWYAEALAHANIFPIAADVSVRVISPPYFIATKLDAFRDRGRGDYLHKDMEDIITVVDGRASIEADVLSSPAVVRAYLIERFRILLADLDFFDAVAGHLPSDSASQARLPLVLSRMRAIANSV